jgi:hypothetical protein
MSRHWRARRRAAGGFILAAVLIFTLIITVAGGGFLALAAGEGTLAAESVLPVKALYLAEAGCEAGRAWLLAQPSPPLQLEPIELTPGTLGQGSYAVTVQPDSGNLNNFLKRYTIVGVGSVAGELDASPVQATKSLNVAMRIESFAKYAYCTQNEYNPDVGQKIWFYSADILTGDVHSNSQFNMSGTPTFHGKVTSTANSVNYYHGGPPADNPTFEEGLQLGAETRDMNPYTNLGRLKSASECGGLKLTCQKAEITFNADATMTYRTMTGGTWGSWQAQALPSNGVIYVEGTAIVSGTLNGRATVAAASGYDIEIPASIEYHVLPTDPGCTDMLGLVAGRGVVVTKSSPAGADMTIHGCIMAFEKSFTVKNYGSIPVMGALHIYGGIIQNYRGPVGTFSGSSGARLSGFAKDYQYDVRLKNTPPPYFPATGRYEQVSWEEGATAYGD